MSTVPSYGNLIIVQWTNIIWDLYSNFTNWVAFSLKGLILYLRRRHPTEEYRAGTVLADTGITSFDLTRGYRTDFQGGSYQEDGTSA